MKIDAHDYFSKPTLAPDPPKRQGKVRDVYDLGDRLLLVATDRISAFDWVLPDGIPDKGRRPDRPERVLVRALNVPNHLISTDIDDAGLDLSARRARCTRGPLDDRPQGRTSSPSSAWSGAISRAAAGTSTAPRGRSAAAPCRRAGRERPDRADVHARPPRPRAGTTRTSRSTRWPARSAEEVAETLQSMSWRFIGTAADHASSRGLILADTKFEWGFDERDRRAAAGGRGADARQLALLADGTRIGPAVRSRRSTSSSSATGSKRPAGTRRARRRAARRRRGPRPAPSTSRPTRS